MLRAIVVDADEPSSDFLEWILTQNGNIEVVGKYVRPKEAIERVRVERLDVAFLETQMPETNGIQIANELRNIDPMIEVVFVTSHNHFATEAFEIGAIDYLLKPLVLERFNKTITRLLERRSVGRDLTERAELSETAKVGFYSFGTFEWICDRQTMTAVKWRRAKERELMAYLLHHRGQFVSKEKIFEELWPTTSPDHAVTFLHSCVYNIRQMITKHDYKAVLEYRSNGYRLEMQNVWFDVDLFERIVAEDIQINVDTLRHYEAIAALYRGDYLEQEEFEWAREKQEKLKNNYLLLMKRLAEFYRSENRLQEAERCLLKALEKNPYLDDVNEMLLTVYAAMGNRHAMVRHYEGFTQLLHEELGIEPMGSTLRLYQKLCSGEAE